MIDLCPLLGSEYSEKYILPIFTQLLQDVNTKVRLNLIMNFDKIKSVFLVLLESVIGFIW